MKTVNRSSGIKGVTYARVLNYEYWLARVQGRLNIKKLFPYTETGKKEAAEFYKKTIEENKNKYYNYRPRIISNVYSTK